MAVEPLITVRNLSSTDSLVSVINDKASKLERFADKIRRCEVIVEAPSGHHHHGGQFRVRVRVTLPGGDLVAGRDPAEPRAHEDVYVAIRDAFDAMERQLKDHSGRKRT
jgi:ribosomal subunit interface protein